MCASCGGASSRGVEFRYRRKRLTVAISPELLRSHDELRAGLRVALSLIRRMRRVRNVDAQPTLGKLTRLLAEAKGIAQDARTPS